MISPLSSAQIPHIVRNKNVAAEIPIGKSGGFSLCGVFLFKLARIVGNFAVGRLSKWVFFRSGYFSGTGQFFFMRNPFGRNCVPLLNGVEHDRRRLPGPVSLEWNFRF